LGKVREADYFKKKDTKRRVENIDPTWLRDETGKFKAFDPPGAVEALAKIRKGKNKERCQERRDKRTYT